MASIVEKYEQIFASDPKSRIFVELARALLERGEPERAIDICERGLENYPSSILGRVIWGRALLQLGKKRPALDQFEIAIALDPGSPYAFNLVGEALLENRLAREALPVLARAAELQPGDERVKAWLLEAKKRATSESATTGAGADAPSHDEGTEPYRSLLVPPSTDGGSDFVVDDPFAVAAAREELAQASEIPPVDPFATSASPFESDGTEGNPPAPSSPAALPKRAVPAPAAPRPVDLDAITERDLPPIDEVPFLPGPPPLPGAASLLDRIPSAPEFVDPVAAPGNGLPSGPPSRDLNLYRAEADPVAASYVEEARQQILSLEPRSASAGRRALAVVVVVAAVAAASGILYGVTASRRAELARTALTRGRAGLARDTSGSLREALALLGEARRASPDDPGLLSLSAQVAGLLAAYDGDGRAASLARELVSSRRAGDGALAARFLLATTGLDRAEAQEAVLDAKPNVSALIETLAGEILIERGEVDAGRGRLLVAARSSPPMLRALADLGDSALASADPQSALDYFGPALEAVPTHPQSIIGAAEARLDLGRDLEVAKKELEAIASDKDSAPPLALRPRFEVAFARVLAGLGDASGAASRLTAAQRTLGESALLATAVAEVSVAARAWDRAELAALRAVALDSENAKARVLLARARAGRGRYTEALAALDGGVDRASRTERAEVLVRLGRPADARAEAEKTVHDGLMPSEAAVWYALADVALGHADRARLLLWRLAESPTSPPYALVALGRACFALSDLDCAEKAFRAAATNDATSPDGRAGLGRVLIARGDFAGAITSLSEAERRDPTNPDVRRSLALARLSSGEPSAAQAELDALLKKTPNDAGALTLLSRTFFAEKKPQEARRAAQQAVKIAPTSVEALLAAARASVALGHRAAAQAYGQRALRLGGSREEVAKVLADPGSSRPPVRRKPRR